MVGAFCGLELRLRVALVGSGVLQELASRGATLQRLCQLLLLLLLLALQHVFDLLDRLLEKWLGAILINLFGLCNAR